MTDHPTNHPQKLKSLSGSGAVPQPAEERKSVVWNPPPLSSLEDTGLTKLNVADLVLKILYFSGDLTGHQISEIVKLR